MMNVIDRTLMEHHIKEKQTVLISKKVSTTSQGKFWYDPGLPYTAYNEIWEEIVSNYGDWENYDIVIMKASEQPFYRVYHGVDEFKKFSGKTKEFDGTYLSYAEKPLTDEEKNWERYDIDKLFPITSYTRILSKLGIFINQVDQIFNTKYHEELSDLASQEKEERKQNKEETKSTPVSDNVLKTNDFTTEEEVETFISTEAADKAGDVFNDVKDDVKEDVKEEVKEETPTRTRKAKATVEKTEINWDELGESLEGIKSMTNAEKVMVHNYDSDKGTFIYINNPSLFSCPTTGCTMKTPEEFIGCPACGVIFE